MKFLKKVISILCSLAITMTLITPNYAHAQNRDSEQLQDVFVEMLDIAEKSEDITDYSTLNNYKNLSVNLIKNNEVNINADNYYLDFDNIKAVRTNYKNENYTSVYIPIKDCGYSLLSALVIMYDSKESLVENTETLITEKTGKFNIESYIGGKLIETKQTDIDYIEDVEIQKGLDEFNELANKQNCSITSYSKKSKKKSSKKKIAACITAIAGINGGIAYLIAGTCIASCPAIVPICVACIGGVCSLGVADIKGIVSCFKL